MISIIEQAICDRLAQGLGKMQTSVTTYGGELDDDLGKIVRRLPAVWVTFGGITGTEPYSLSKRQWRTTGSFAVIAGDYSTRDEQTSRQGGPRYNEVGTYNLIYAIRRLLTGQDLGLKMNPLKPTRVRTLFNTRLEARAVSVFSLEFEAVWLEESLPCGAWPEPCDNTGNREHLFTKYRGRLAEPAPDLLCVGLRYNRTGVDPADAPEDLVKLRDKTP